MVLLVVNSKNGSCRTYFANQIRYNYDVQSSTHGTRQVPHYQIFWIIRQYLYWMKSLQAILCYCPHRSCMTLASYFHTIIKKLAFSAIIGPVMGFPSECTAVNHLHNTLSNCANSGSFKICCLIRLFTLSLKATNDRNWSLHFSVSQRVMIWCIMKS